MYKKSLSVNEIVSFFFKRTIKENNFQYNEKSLFLSKHYNINISKDEIIVHIKKEKKRKKNDSENIGLLMHKIIQLYFDYNDDFNINLFLNKNVNNKLYQEKLKIIIDIFKNTFDKKKEYLLLNYEFTINYNNFIYGKPDAIFKYKNNKLIFQFYNKIGTYYPDLMLGVKDLSILDNYNKEINKNSIFLVDWKCIKKNIFIKHIFSQFLLDKYLHDTKYNKYLIQLNIYKYILEEKYNYNVSELFIFLINPSINKSFFFPILSLKKSFIKKLLCTF